MQLEDVEEAMNTVPFQAFKIHMTSGASFAVTHPEQVMMTETKMIVGVGGNPQRRIVEHVEHCAYSHIAHIEEMPSAQ